MDADLSIVLGICLVALSLWPLLNGFTEGRVPRVPALMILCGSVLVAYALQTQPTGYSFGELPQVFARVFGQLLG
jgi:hypothetical protein